MDTIITYVAKDGTEFTDEYECMDYEEKINHLLNVKKSLEGA